MRSLFVTILIFAGIYVALVLGMQRRMIYPRPFAPGSLPKVAGLEHWQLGPAKDVDAFYLAPTARQPDRSPVIVFAHGNGELIDMWAPAFQVPRSWGVAMLLVEYPGYGRSAGSPSESSIAAVFRDAYDQLVQRADVDSARIVGYGRSLGGGAVCGLSGERQLAALILESTFTGLAPLAAGMLVPKPLVLDRFDNLAAVSSFERPILLLHGEHDPLIPSAHAEQLRGASAQAELHLMPCGHNDCPQRWDLIESFLRKAEILRTAPVGGA